MDLFLYLLMGIGLSAASGFKVFVPLLLISAANLSGNLELSREFAWLGSQPAFMVFLTASILEVSAYFIPGLDNLLDNIEGPAAFVAGTVITASFIGEMTPLLRIILSIIAGGGTASAVQFSTASARSASTIFTLGTANFSINIFETITSAVISVLSLVYPYLVIIIILTLSIFFVKKLWLFFTGRR